MLEAYSHRQNQEDRFDCERGSRSDELKHQQAIALLSQQHNLRKLFLFLIRNASPFNNLLPKLIPRPWLSELPSRNY